jgi:hypothetical protein
MNVTILVMGFINIIIIHLVFHSHLWKEKNSKNFNHPPHPFVEWEGHCLCPVCLSVIIVTLLSTKEEAQRLSLYMWILSPSVDSIYPVLTNGMISIFQSSIFLVYVAILFLHHLHIWYLYFTVDLICRGLFHIQSVFNSKQSTENQADVMRVSTVSFTDSFLQILPSLYNDLVFQYNLQLGQMLFEVFHTNHWAILVTLFLTT